MRKHFLDLFSGFGGASEAFTEDLGNWSVLRIDNNPLLSGVPFTVIDDVKLVANDLNPAGMFPRCIEKIECIWASPPCRDFSNGYSSPKSKHIREHGIDSYEPDMSLLTTALDIIDTVKPKYWVIENVVGSIRYFKEYLGEPRQIIGPYVLWGNFPFLELQEPLQTKASKDVHSSDPLRANHKAKVDYAISKALKVALEKQTSILDFN